VRLWRLSATLSPLVLVACASARIPAREPPLARRVQAPGLLFEVVVYTRSDRNEVGRIGGGLVAAGPRLARWGSFKQGVWIRVFPDHESLEAAVHKKDYPWLRAWAYPDQILLQSPRTWNPESPAALEEELSELLVHELTHSLMYQLLEPGDEGWKPDAAIEDPPLWFREGMASVTAGQGHRRLSGEDLARWIAAHPGADLLHPPSELYRTEKEAVYGAAHRAFDLLVSICGDQAIRDVLRGVRTGARFADSFQAATGHELAEFEREAIRSHFDVASARLKPATGAGGP
jgi:hypothetical protein